MTHLPVPISRFTGRERDVASKRRPPTLVHLEPDREVEHRYNVIVMTFYDKPGNQMLMEASS